MGKWKPNRGIRMTAENKPKYKDIGGMSYEEILDLAKTQKLKNTDEFKKARRRLRNE